VTYQKKSSSDF